MSRARAKSPCDTYSNCPPELVAALDSDRYLRLLDTLDDLLTTPPLTARAGKPARKELPALVGRGAGRVERAARTVTSAETPQARDRALHDVRKSAKRTRYAAETTIPVAGDPATEFGPARRPCPSGMGHAHPRLAAGRFIFTRGHAVWNLPDGPLDYLDFTMAPGEVKYNVAPADISQRP